MRLLFLAVTALLAVACSGDNDEPAVTVTATPPDIATGQARTPSGAPTSVAPPGATLTRTDGTSIKGGIGTRCWANFCADYVAPITNVDPLSAAPGEMLTLAFEEGAPGELAVEWHKVTAAPPQPGPEGRAWNGLYEGFLTPNPQPSGLTVTAPTEPGDYVLAVFAAWPPKGDISYGFYVTVK